MTLLSEFNQNKYFILWGGREACIGLSVSYCYQSSQPAADGTWHVNTYKSSSCWYSEKLIALKVKVKVKVKDFYYNKIIIIHRMTQRLKPIWSHLLFGPWSTCSAWTTPCHHDHLSLEGSSCVTPAPHCHLSMPLTWLISWQDLTD